MKVTDLPCGEVWPVGDLSVILWFYSSQWHGVPRTETPPSSWGSCGEFRGCVGQAVHTVNPESTQAGGRCHLGSKVPTPGGRESLLGKLGSASTGVP